MKNFVKALVIALAVMSMICVLPVRPTRAEEKEGANQETIARLDQILKQQQEILATLASLKEDVRILTVRVTQNQ